MSIWLVTVLCLLVLTAFAGVLGMADGRQRVNLRLGAALLGFWVVFGTAALDYIRRQRKRRATKTNQRHVGF